MPRVGIFDSGVGGLTVFKEVERALPQHALIYLGDTARVPYGTKSAETVERYAIEATHFLRSHDVELLVVACNTASAVAMESVRRESPAPALGVIEPGARRAVEATRNKRIGVIGTRATIGSGAYTRAIHAVDPDCHVVSRPCPLFVPLAEEGWTEGEISRSIAVRYLEPLLAEEIDTLVLGCTHYPLLRELIADVAGAGVVLVDSAESVAAEARALLADQAKTDGGQATEPEHHFYVTDVPEPFQQVADRFLGRPLRRLERARIEGE
jgi:glutamate racemase